jgi:ACT domain-containing protein
MVLDAALHRADKPSNAAIAIIYTGLDDKEHALDWLEKAYQERDTIMTHLKVDPLFDTLRSQPRFQQLIRRMHLD